MIQFIWKGKTRRPTNRIMGFEPGTAQVRARISRCDPSTSKQGLGAVGVHQRTIEGADGFSQSTARPWMHDPYGSDPAGQSGVCVVDFDALDPGNPRRKLLVVRDEIKYRFMGGIQPRGKIKLDRCGRERGGCLVQ
jgi:hypothetical protein